MIDVLLCIGGLQLKQVVIVSTVVSAQRELGDCFVVLVRRIGLCVLLVALQVKLGNISLIQSLHQTNMRCINIQTKTDTASTGLQVEIFSRHVVLVVYAKIVLAQK